MQANAVHRDREATHLGHYRTTCASDAPSSVRTKIRRKIRAAGRASLRDLLAEALIERYELDA